MNRIFRTFLLLSIVISPAISQEPDTVQISRQSDSVRVTQEPDTVQISRLSDSIQVTQEPDTVQISRLSDSIIVVQKIDSIFQYGERDLRQADTLAVKQPDFSHSPYKAIMHALVLPGLGQAYNQKYYKIPIVYAALGGVGYAIVFNTRQYRESSYNYAQQPDDINERYLRYWRRNVELSYIGLILVYALQVLDAYVDAQLYSWDVNENLSLRIAPSMQPIITPASVSGQSYGFTCSIDIRRR